MKILYINASAFNSQGFSIANKIKMQSSALLGLGVTVQVLDSNCVGFSSGSVSEFRRRFWHVAEEAISTSKPDLLYIRYPGAEPYFYRFLSRAKVLIITEHQTKEIEEYITTRRLSKAFSEWLFGSRSLRKATGLVCVTKEIEAYERARFGNEAKLSAVIGNGIDVASIPLREPAVFDGKNLEVLCVAQVAKWHGLDRLIRGIAEYKGSVNVRLHILGNGSEVPILKKLVSDLKIDHSVFLHGFKTGKELDEFFDKCHIAVGSLAVHRKGLNETSELKAREYCSRGISFFCSVPDSDFCDDFPYILRVPSNEESVDVKSVISFVERVLPNIEHSESMRHYAENHLDWSIKMKQLLKFANEVSGGKVMK